MNLRGFLAAIIDENLRKKGNSRSFLHREGQSVKRGEEGIYGDFDDLGFVCRRGTGLFGHRRQDYSSIRRVLWFADSPGGHRLGVASGDAKLRP